MMVLYMSVFGSHSDGVCSRFDDTLVCSGPSLIMRLSEGGWVVLCSLISTLVA
jgi:hypothetical protein